MYFKTFNIFVKITLKNLYNYVWLVGINNNKSENNEIIEDNWIHIKTKYATNI